MIEGGIESIRVFMLMTGTIWCDGHPSFFAPTQNAFLLVGAARELEAPPLLCICMVWNLHDPEAICDTEGCQEEETDDGMGEKGSDVCSLCRQGETGKERDEREGAERTAVLMTISLSCFLILVAVSRMGSTAITIVVGSSSGGMIGLWLVPMLMMTFFMPSGSSISG